MDCDGLERFCTRAAIEARLAPCIVNRVTTPYYAMRCGPYDVVVAQGTDSARYFYYDEAGRLIAENEVGLAARGCVSYSSGFVLPDSCELATPECDDAGSE